MIPNGTKVRLRNVHNDSALKHVDGFEGEVVGSHYLPLWERRYTVLINGLDYDLSKDEIEVI